MRGGDRRSMILGIFSESSRNLLGIFSESSRDLLSVDTRFFSPSPPRRAHGRGRSSPCRRARRAWWPSPKGVRRAPSDWRRRGRRGAGRSGEGVAAVRLRAGASHRRRPAGTRQLGPTRSQRSRGRSARAAAAAAGAGAPTAVESGAAAAAAARATHGARGPASMCTRGGGWPSPRRATHNNGRRRCA